jgi:hypothetical protein
MPALLDRVKKIGLPVRITGLADVNTVFAADPDTINCPFAVNDLNVATDELNEIEIE